MWAGWVGAEVEAVAGCRWRLASTLALGGGWPGSSCQQPAAKQLSPASSPMYRLSHIDAAAAASSCSSPPSSPSPASSGCCWHGSTISGYFLRAGRPGVRERRGRVFCGLFYDARGPEVQAAARYITQG